MKQILSALEFMHGRGIMHRDLKPANILLNRDCTTKISDLGAALELSEQQLKEELVRESEEQVTRWYRSPELLRSSCHFLPSDVWSAGCVHAEMILGRPIFPGNDGEQLNTIRRVMQTPIDQVFGTTDVEELELIHDMLAVDPRERWRYL